MSVQVGTWTITIYPHTIRAGETVKFNAVISGQDADGALVVKALKPEPTAQRAEQVARYYLEGKPPPPY